MFGQLGKTLIFTGIILIVVGVLLLLMPHIPILGRLPGDIHLKGRRWSFYFPVATSILLSIILTLLLWLINHFRGK
ncbi:MAG: DUF2905 family protein [Candidatus Sumerlaeota bacterium]|nr:DUF2905 family protein [Candidatus Sumerlaeota bacterium]